MKWICKWFTRYYSQQKRHTSISPILSTFEGVLGPCKHSSMLQVKAKFGLAFIHALILLLGSFLLLARRLVVCEKKRLHPLLIHPKHENASGINDPCSTWRIHWLYSHFLSFSFFLWTAGRLWCKWHLTNGLKTLTSQKTVCLLIYNTLADASALAWLLVFEDFGSSSPVIGVSNDLITTFLQTSPSISGVRFLSSLYLITTSSPFGQDKACCKLNKSPQTHSVNKHRRKNHLGLFLNTSTCSGKSKNAY